MAALQAKRQALWQVYQQVFFVSPEGPVNFAQFAIITACNPLGRICSAAQNAAYQSGFSKTMTEHHQTQPILAGDRQMAHVEPSLALVVSQPQAQTIAAQAMQNAFYWVEHDQLWLLPCLLQGFMPLLMGSFSARLIADQLQ